jgi:hypothetical protein
MHKFGIETIRSRFIPGVTDQQSGKEMGVFPETVRQPLPEEEAFSLDRRGFKRVTANFPACIGDARSKTGDFAIGTIHDISMGGVRLSVPRGTNLISRSGCEAVEFSISFSLPNNPWPIGVKCLSKRVVDLGDEIQIGAAFVVTDIRSHHALQQYMN